MGVTALSLLATTWFACGSQSLGYGVNEYMDPEWQCDGLATLDACSHVYQDSDKELRRVGWNRQRQSYGATESPKISGITHFTTLTPVLPVRPVHGRSFMNERPLLMQRAQKL